MIKPRNLKIAFFLIPSIMIIFFGIYYFCYIRFSENTATINGYRFKIEVLTDPEAQSLGMSDKPELEKDRGMLFQFPKKEVRYFWMKNMNFPLDIVWINDDEIVKISKNLPAEDGTPENIYGSDQIVNNVLEINAKLSDEYNFRIGDKVIFNIKK
jgi:uncharacterized protein